MPAPGLNVVYLKKKSTGGFDVSLLAESGSHETFLGVRVRNALEPRLTGFLLYCRREREICRAIDARRELEEIKANRHSNRKKIALENPNGARE